jgi:AAA domain
MQDENFIPPIPEERLTDEQSEAMSEILSWLGDPHERFFSLCGPAGAGKTWLLRRIVDAVNWKTQVTLSAMTGRAALRMTQLCGRSASTLHSTLYYAPEPGEAPRFTRLKDPVPGLLVIDEASMMTPSVYRDLVRWTGTNKILFVGDDFQLPPVMVGKEAEDYGDSYSVFIEMAGVRLRSVMRNSGGLLEAADRIRRTSEIPTENLLDPSGDGYVYVSSRDAVGYAVRQYLDDPDDHLLVTWRNAVRMDANRMIRAALGLTGPLPDEGEPVIIRRNGQGFLNGETVSCGGFTQGPKLGSLRTLWMDVADDVYDRKRVLVTVDGGSSQKGGEPMDGGSPWVEDWKKYLFDLKKNLVNEPLPITWGYVNTAHTAQGSEARRVTVFLAHGDKNSKNFNKSTSLASLQEAPFSSRFLYTALTRGKRRSMLVTP